MTDPVCGASSTSNKILSPASFASPSVPFSTRYGVSSILHTESPFGASCVVFTPSRYKVKVSVRVAVLLS